ncbi:MAG: hypothetical protein KUG77_05940 [Nannocystaceae bacterium]|nr:hypothetical protein [Nannocystaceae bacterium]
MRRFVALAWLAFVSCDDGDRFIPVVLDTSPNCARATAQVLVPNLDRPEQPWSRVVAVALDEPGRLDFWALVEVDDSAAQFAMMHVRGGAVDHRVDLSGFLPDTIDLELRPGPAAGSAWLVESGPGSYRVWQFEAVSLGADPLRAVSPNLGWFPGSLAQLCPPESADPFEEPEFTSCDVTHWHRELAFIEGQAFLLSTPPFSPNATMYVYAGRLRIDLGITEQTQLEFFRRCTDELLTTLATPCDGELDETTYPSLIVMGSQQDPSDPVHHQFILRDRETNRIPVSREAVGLALDLDEDNKLRGFVFSRALDEVSIMPGPPSGLANDSIASYLLHPVEEGGARVTRLRTDTPDDGYIEDRFEVLSGIPLPDAPESLALLQLPGDVALGWLDNGAWEILKLFPDAPASSERSRYAPEAAVTAVQPAGRGAYLVFKDHELGPDLVQVRCSDDD